MLRLNDVCNKFHYRAARLIINGETYWGLLIDVRCDEDLVKNFNEDGFFIYETKRIDPPMTSVTIEDRVLTSFKYTLILLKPIQFDDDTDKHVSATIDRIGKAYVGTLKTLGFFTSPIDEL